MGTTLDAFQLARTKLGLDELVDESLPTIYQPVADWVAASHALAERCVVIGVNGAQGSGKSTFCALLKPVLEELHQLKVAVLSIDDVYHTRETRLRLSEDIHPLCQIRGVPGTHDVQLAIQTIDALSASHEHSHVAIPRFDKASDDRKPADHWDVAEGAIDVILFEGWCVGAKSENNNTLKKTINLMEKLVDKKQIWRKYVNQQLKTKYKNLYSQLNCLIYLKAKNFRLLQKWRLKQERKLWLKSKKNSKLKIMKRGDVINFMQTYQRITQNMFKNMPKYASIIFNLNSHHQIKSAIYKNK